ncbi:hypothetical protein CR513_32176 [Mucuna pruriens]|uniref:Uncharacterized protein n=1 Tax=Mucuna pruriens TaxID=157652 RepID=A0A371G7G3_MUCPR|nr:hypothetical protein CR513_32176 [Mucuna pruriens]
MELGISTFTSRLSKLKCTLAARMTPLVTNSS